jgi:hypothetical protein
MGKINAFLRSAMTLTLSRHASCMDIRFVCWTLVFVVGSQNIFQDGLCHDHSPRFPPENKYNIDATTICCCARGTGLIVVVVKGSDSGPIQSRKISGQLDIYVKLMAMINAEGNISRTVLITADDAIPEDNFFAHPLLGISTGGRVGDYG